VWSRSAFERFSLFLEIVSGFLEEAPDEVVSNLARNGPRSARALEAPSLPPGASRSLAKLSGTFLFFVLMNVD